MLKIEIFEEDERILTRNIPAKDDRPAREIREQIAYAHLGGKFPVEMKLQIEEGQPHYAAGLYTVLSHARVLASEKRQYLGTLSAYKIYLPIAGRRS
ncbi:hypothetical protein BZJ17_15855 [Salinivibrio sp. IB574]|uniref:single-stranded DNA-binding protein n=1 Tax=Salinivibrio sp. IB574 TaxID=1909444 RepID=UPI000988D387|nr:single-stranded DNA-binding protein [Salinivibrio sp. IB574]OOF18870.1 hypothetical protein BZJ17_15855 [Salinivibrio sp. IB574]